MPQLPIKTPKKRVKKVAYYPLYLLSCDKMKRSKVPSLKSLQRSIRPACKTTLLDDSILCFKLKNETHGVMIRFEVEQYSKGVWYYTVTSTLFPNVSYSISASSTKELMSKINYSYHLIQPSNDY